MRAPLQGGPAGSEVAVAAGPSAGELPAAVWASKESQLGKKK